jgi:hypothetical protein
VSISVQFSLRRGFSSPLKPLISGTTSSPHPSVVLHGFQLFKARNNVPLPLRRKGSQRG